MSELNTTKDQLHKAHYFYGECADSLELAREDAQKAGGLFKKMNDLLFAMHVRRRAALEKAVTNAAYNEEALNQAGLALDILHPIRDQIPGSEKLSQPLVRAFQSLGEIEKILDYAVHILGKQAPYATRQMIETDTGLKVTIGQNHEAQEHFTEAAAACTEYIQHL